MELNFKYREHLKEYSVEENGYCYYMPYKCIINLQEFVKSMPESHTTCIEEWYLSLTAEERRSVEKRSKAEEKLTSLW